jgi:hypothetical protein
MLDLILQPRIEARESTQSRSALERADRLFTAAVLAGCLGLIGAWIATLVWALRWLWSVTN